MDTRLPLVPQRAATRRAMAIVVGLLPFMAATAATAQIQTRTGTLLQARMAVSATVTFRAYDLGGTLNGVPLALQLSYVTISTPLAVTLTANPKSVVHLVSSTPLASGSYGVRLDFNFVNLPLTLTGTTGSVSGPVVGSCALQAATTGTTVQSCEIPVAGSGGPLDLWVAVSGANNGSVSLTNVTVNQYRALTRTP